MIFEGGPAPVVIGHRGMGSGPLPVPENTIASLLATVEAGLSWVEVDVQRTGDRVSAESSGASSLESLMAAGAKEKADVHAMASIDAHSAAVLVSNYHDSAKAGPAAPF